jgi:iron complex outermembrane receptor protein
VIAAVAAGGVIVLGAVSTTRGQTPEDITETATDRSSNAAANTADVERVIVTGSHIPTAAEVGPNPVQQIDREYLEKSGARTAEQFLRDLPVAGPQGVPSFNGANGGTAGASSISLRGFDPSDTLVLIDGRRVAFYPVGAASTQSFVDLNSIPRAAIDSIEILKDSASSIYGADAVAGVVNIKLRHDYRGAESSIEYGNSTDKDSGQYASSLVFGAGDDQTNVCGVLNFYHRNSLFDIDRGFSNFGLSVFSSPFNLQLSREAVIAAGGTPPSDRPTFFGHAPFLSNGLAPASEYVYTNRRSSFYNFELGRGAVAESERYGGFVNAEHKVCGDQLVLYGDFFYQNVKTHDELAATPTGFFEEPNHLTIAIPPHAPGATLGGPSYAETGVPLGAFNPFNPFQQIISGGSTGRTAEFGNRLIDNETDAFFSTLGVKGDKLFDGNWGYDLSFRYSEITDNRVARFTSASRFNRILNAADPIFDPASSQFIGTTTPYNPFGDYRVPIPSNAQSIDFATVFPKDVNISKLTTLDLNIYTTELFKLPAGGIGLAFGGQFRRETLAQQPDELALSGDILGTSSKATFTDAGRKLYAFYAEASIPIFSPSFAISGFHSLEFTAAARYEELRSNGSNVLVPKVGMRWQPLDESLTIRATWGEGFHEPSLIELFGSPNQFLSSPFDPLAPETPVVIRSNPNLQPEDSRAFSAGIVYTPKLLPELTLTVDVFDIESVGRVISHPEVDAIIQRDLQNRLLPGERVNRGPEGNITSIEGAFQNGGSQKARGADFGVQYQRQTPYGTITSLTQATYLDSFQFAPVPGATEQELRGSSPGFSEEAYFKWKGDERLDWAWHNFDLVTTVHYRDGFHELLFIDRASGTKFEHWVKQTWFFDALLSYTVTFPVTVENNPVAGYSNAASKDSAAQSPRPAIADFGAPCWKRLLNGTTISVGCNNIFGQDPPRSLISNYPVFAYDPTGRFVYVSLTKKFW